MKIEELKEPVVNEPTKELQTKKYRYCITVSYEIETELDTLTIINEYQNMSPNTFKKNTVKNITITPI